MSLRQLEKIYTNLAIFYGTSSKNHLRRVPLIVFLATIKVIKPGLFADLLHQRVSYENVSHQLNFSELDEESKQSHKLFWFMSWIRFSLLSEDEYNGLPEDDRIKRFDGSLWEYHMRREELIVYFARQINMFNVT